MIRPAQPSGEIGRRARQIYATQLRQILEPRQAGRLVAIDVRSGEYEVGDSVLHAATALRNRLPDAEIYTLRVGQDAVYRIGAKFRTESP